MELPAFARYCARCGNALPPELDVPVWIVVTLGVGAVMAGLFGIVYALLLVDPGLTAATGTGYLSVSQTTLAVLALGCAAMVLVQAAAVTGLIRGRDWGKLMATIACVGWAMTCLLAPLSFLLLFFLWRPAPQARR
jgi:hypothetical protein